MCYKLIKLLKIVTILFFSDFVEDQSRPSLNLLLFFSLLFQVEMALDPPDLRHLITRHLLRE